MEFKNPKKGKTTITCEKECFNCEYFMEINSRDENFKMCMWWYEDTLKDIKKFNGNG